MDSIDAALSLSLSEVLGTGAGIDADFTALFVFALEWNTMLSNPGFFFSTLDKSEES